MVLILILLSLGLPVHADVGQCESALKDLKRECEGRLTKVNAKIVPKRADGRHAEGQVKELRAAQERTDRATAGCREQKAEFDKVCVPAKVADKSEKAKMQRIAAEATAVSSRAAQKKAAMEAGVAKARGEQEKAKRQNR